MVIGGIKDNLNADFYQTHYVFLILALWIKFGCFIILISPTNTSGPVIMLLFFADERLLTT